MIATMTDAEILQRWPRVILGAQWAACLSWGEAIACIRDYKAGREYSGEAVNHFGGTRIVLQRAATRPARQYARDRWHAGLRPHEIERRAAGG